MQLTIPNTFANGTGEANIIDAPKMNANFNAVVNVLNGNIEKDNIKTGSAIALRDTAQAITGLWTFNTNPAFNSGAISDNALTSNIPKLNAANVFTAKQTFNAGIDMGKQQVEQIVIHKLAAAPSSPVNGQIYYNTTDNKFYGWNGSQWNQIDYIGGYTGGAVRSYSSVGLLDDGDQYKFLFKTEGSTPTVKLFIKGEPYPKRYYTELAYHTHAFTGNAHNHGITDPAHKHQVDIGSHGHGATQYAISTHTHGVSGSTGGRSVTHVHGAVQTGTSNTAVDVPDHSHSVSITSAAASASQQIPNADLGDIMSDNGSTGITINNAVAGGSNAYAGIEAGSLSSVQKLYGKNLIVKIDGTTVTSNVLTATGWSAIGDGTGSHAFHTTGTGEMDASGWVTYTAGYHTLEVIEPDSGYGCSVLVHIETS